MPDLSQDLPGNHCGAIWIKKIHKIFSADGFDTLLKQKKYAYKMSRLLICLWFFFCYSVGGFCVRNGCNCIPAAKCSALRSSGGRRAPPFIPSWCGSPGKSTLSDITVAIGVNVLFANLSSKLVLPTDVAPIIESRIVDRYPSDAGANTHPLSRSLRCAHSEAECGSYKNVQAYKWGWFDISI